MTRTLELRSVSTLRAVVLAVICATGLGCTPSIGDKCVLSTDCSLRGDRLCDTSEPGGYCTIFNCRGDLCPDTAACVLFNANVQGCGYDDRSVSRTGRTFCMAQCTSNSDCRGGYICSDPRQAPWNAIILDDNQLQRVCIVPPDNGLVGQQSVASMPDAAVCKASAPPFDAAVDPPDGSPPDGAAPDGSAPGLMRRSTTLVVDSPRAFLILSMPRVTGPFLLQ